MIMDILLIQNWWHIEAIWYPRPAQKIRQVMDIIVDKHQKSITFDYMTHVSDIHVYARNAGNKELAINIPKNEIPGNPIQIRFIFNPKDFPVVDAVDFPDIYEEYGISSHMTLYYLKIELTYTDFSSDLVPDIRLYRGKIAPVLTWEYKALVKGPVRPEFYITAPRGWAITPVKFPNAGFNEGNGTDAMIFSNSLSMPPAQYQMRLDGNIYSVWDLNPKTYKIIIDDEKRRYLYEFNKNIIGECNKIFKSGSDEYVVFLKYTITPSNFAIILTLFQITILMLGFIFLFVHLYICAFISPDKEGLIWPILTTIATWITLTEINIQQERRGYFYPWRKGYKAFILYIYVIEMLMILFMVVNTLLKINISEFIFS